MRKTLSFVLNFISKNTFSSQSYEIKTEKQPLFKLVGVSLVSACLSAPVFAQKAIDAPLVSAVNDVGEMWNEAPLDLSEHGLTENEYYFEGDTDNGEYKSRMIVRLPVDQEKFNGTVIVEWMNASSGADIDVDFLSLLPLIERDGYAYVAVTSQTPSVNFLVDYNPERYGDLNMARASRYEVFSQAAKALLDNGTGIDPMQGLTVERLIAIGQSQSSQRMTEYVSDIHGIKLEPIFDAFIPHSGADAPTRFPVPVLKLNSENEAPAYFGERDVADANYRYWEVPGTAHQPLAGTDYAVDLLVKSRGEAFECPFPYFGIGGPTPIDPVLRAAVAHVNTWIQDGVAPPEAPLMDMKRKLLNANKGTIQRDQYGNALGGIRMPQQVVPTGRNTPSYGCEFKILGLLSFTMDLFPQYDAFDGNNDPAKDSTDHYEEPASVSELYPTHASYVDQFTEATLNLYSQGFILWPDAEAMIEEAEASSVGL